MRERASSQHAPRKQGRTDVGSPGAMSHFRALLFTMLQLSAGASAMHVTVDSQQRSISWWVQPPHEANDPAVDALLGWVKSHKHIVTTLIMECGVETCTHNTTAGAPRTSCVNPGYNGGFGGRIAGTLKPACAKLIPELTTMGVRSELWLGEDDSRESALALFAHPKETAADLLALANKYPGLSGFNIDMETDGSVPADATLFAEFLKQLTPTLNGAQHPLRVSADVSCVAEGHHSWCPVIGNCTLLATSGVNRVMNMGTYNAGNYQQWMSMLAPALDVPRESLGVGLGCWVDSKTNGTWSTEAASAEARICALMNASVTELDMFLLDQSGRPRHPGVGWLYANAPEPFWVAQLEKFMSGGGCVPSLSPIITCPAASVGPKDSWRPAADATCCESDGKR
jgi:hypothetical protein